MFQGEAQGKKEAEDEYEATYAKFRSNPARDSKFKDATDFRDSRTEKEPQNKVIPETSPRGEAEEVPQTDDFGSRIESFKAEMDNFIPLVNIPHKTLSVGNGSGRNRVNTRDPEEKISDHTETDSLESRPLAEKTAHSIPENENPQVITDNKPAIVPTNYRLDYESVKSPSAPSLHTGARVHVNRVPSEFISPSTGSSMMGFYPHSSAWTKSPQWAQAIIAFALGAIIGGLGFGAYKLVQKAMYGKVLANNKTATRSHPREWNPERNSTPPV